MEMEVLKICNLCKSSEIFQINKNYNISQCKKCGYIFDNPRPTVREIIDFYSNVNKYDSWLFLEQARYGMDQNRLRKIKKHIKSGALLDVGAGTGQFLHSAKKYFQIKGTEVSDSAASIAYEKYGVRLKKGELENIDFGGEKFDIVTMFHVLEHVPSPMESIEKCKSLLKKNGLLVIAVPNDTCSFQSKIKGMLASFRIGRFKYRGPFGLRKLTLDGSIDEIHLSHFTVPVLKKLLIRNGFEIIENSLDPFYPVKPIKKIVDDLLYVFFSLINKVFGKNFYPTIWMVAKLK